MSLVFVKIVVTGYRRVDFSGCLTRMLIASIPMVQVA